MTEIRGLRLMLCASSCDRLSLGLDPGLHRGTRPVMAKLYFYYAAMNAGKSTTLLQADFNYRERGMQTMLWTAAFDDRAGVGAIASRIGLRTGARLYEAQ